MNKNPYYDPASLDLEMISFERPPEYDFDILVFWATKSGLIFTASDSGCSCPTPFEGYMGETQRDVIQQLERVRNASHALSIFKSWNSEYDGTKVPSSDRMKLADWVNAHINNKSDAKPVVKKEAVKATPNPVVKEEPRVIDIKDNMVVRSTLASVLDNANLKYTVDGEDVNNDDLDTLIKYE